MINKILNLFLYFIFINFYFMNINEEFDIIKLYVNIGR